MNGYLNNFFPGSLFYLSSQNLSCFSGIFRVHGQLVLYLSTQWLHHRGFFHKMLTPQKKLEWRFNQIKQSISSLILAKLKQQKVFNSGSTQTLEQS